MPELAEVEYYRKQWDPALGQKVTGVDCHATARVFRGADGKELAKRLPQSVYRESVTHGKQMLFRFGDEIWLGLHLGMTGSLETTEPEHEADAHEHLVIHFKERSLVFRDPRKFGRVQTHFGKETPPWWSGLPPEVLSDEFSLERLKAHLQRHPKPAVKAVLLDQSFFPGIGNWMADEVLWQARIHPAQPAGSLTLAAARKLWEQLRRVCRESLDTIGVDWSDPPEEWLFGHRWKAGGHCPRPGCGKPLARDTVGGRTTCWCPRCQVRKA